MKFTLTVGLLFVLSCATTPPGGESGRLPLARQAGADLGSSALIDLTHPLDESTVFWPTANSTFKLERVSYGMTAGGFFYASNNFCTPEHGGTHLDAPIHFAKGGWTSDQIPLENLIGPAVVLDVRSRAASDADYRLTVEDIKSWETRHGLIGERSIVVLQTGWSARWPDRKRYMGDDTPGDASKLHFPSYSAEAARLLVEQRKVIALGVDTASIDYGPSIDFMVHRIANGANVSGIENLTNLDRLPPRGAWIIALPVKITGGSGGPARVIAVVPR